MKCLDSYGLVLFGLSFLELLQFQQIQKNVYCKRQIWYSRLGQIRVLNGFSSLFLWTINSGNPWYGSSEVCMEEPIKID